jgi:hypothetical protein
MASAWHGMSKVPRTVCENTDDPTRFNFEFGSNETIERDLHNENHEEPMLSTLEGSTIERKAPREKAKSPMRSNLRKQI